MKQCSRCEEWKVESDFYKEKNVKCGLRSECKACTDAANKQWRKNNRKKWKKYSTEWRRKHPEKHRESCKKYKEKYPERRKDTVLKGLYGITLKDKESMLCKQGNKCIICRKKITMETADIDHCHKTNTVRGLLCRKCNTALGLFSEDVQSLKNAIKYLEKI